MILDNKIISYMELPLFQKARFKTPTDMEGAIRDFACFFYIVEGNMLSFDSRGLHHIGEKEAVIKNCNNYVQRYMPSDKSEECEAIAVYLYPEILKSIYKDEVPSFLKIEENPNPTKLIGNQLIEQFMMNLILYFENPETFDEDLARLKLKELMLILLKSSNHESIRQLLSEIFHPINVQFKESIEANILNPLSMEQLAFICNMSLSTFKREFKKTFNDTPAKYIKRRRLEYSSMKLIQSNESITSIAFASGFQDLSTFSASFQEKFGISPKEFRKSQIRKI